MQLILSKHKDNIIYIIWWLSLSKQDIHTSSLIHPCIQVQYKIEDRIILSGEEITNISDDWSTWPL